MPPIHPTPTPGWVVGVLLIGALALAASYLSPVIRSFRALSAAMTGAIT